jgi:hypothetical protein
MYLASTQDAASADEREVEWFKIYESGLLAAQPRWWATNVGLVSTLLRARFGLQGLIEL